MSTPQESAQRRAAKRAAKRWDALLKPPRSLGLLEEAATRLAQISGAEIPRVRPATVVVIAGDHGVVQQNVSAFPRSITAQMVGHFLDGGTAITVLADLHKLKLHVVDVGVAEDVGMDGNLPGPSGQFRSGQRTRFTSARVRGGTADFTVEPAMSRADAEAAFAVGRRVAEQEWAHGTRLLIAAEMGIGNTTAAAAVAAALLRVDPHETVGPGSGLAPADVRHKTNVVARALALHKPDPEDPLDVLAKVGGLEIAALAGLMVGAATRRLPVLLDGYITGVAALAATRMRSDVGPVLIAGHRSSEPGHLLVLEALNLIPLLDLSMGLGEGSGAAVAFPVLEAAVKLLAGMKTFAEAGIGKGATAGSPSPPLVRRSVTGPTAPTADTSPPGRPIMFLGTGSDVGKSLLSAAFCRIFRQDGWRVAPFKAQNMSRQTFITDSGAEIAHSQAVQALAAGIKPDPAMNPILLKPLGEQRSRLFVMGHPLADLSWGPYRERHDENMAVIDSALSGLLAAYDVVVMEGAGSPAEVNLMDRDVANMAVADLADAPVILVVDIERGGAFASLLGTYEILSENHRRRLAGYILNKFRGDPDLLNPALAWVEERTGLPCLGIVPWLPTGGAAFGPAAKGQREAAWPDDGSQVALDTTLDGLADAVRASVDFTVIYRVMGLGEVRAWAGN